jgi:hypothetical protein
MNNAAHWLNLAEDARKLADRMRDPEAKQTMLAVARGYQKLAQHAALFADSSPSVNNGVTKSD